MRRMARGRHGSGDTRPVRRPFGLYDIALVVETDGGLAWPERVDASLSAAELVELVHRAGADDCDIRILNAPGEQNLPALRAVAQRLGRDILIAPIGAEVVRLPPTPPATTDTGSDADELVPIDATSGYPVDWLTVQPSGDVGAAFGWFDLVGGLVAPRSGLVALPLSGGGRMVATRETFVRARDAAAALRPGHPGLVTVGVEVRGGDFVLGLYNHRTVLADGVELAAALSALPLYRANLRLWLRWPTTAPDRHHLRGNVELLAEATGATVWVPDEPGGVTMLDGCLDLAAIDASGRAQRWRAYGPPGPFESDVDGRLVPVGGVRVIHMPAARLVSGHAFRDRELAGRQGPPGPRGASPFTCDLAVLADGRLAVSYHDNSLLAVGARQFALLLEEAGWTGGDVFLLSTVTPEQAPGTRRHLADLAAHIGAAIRLGEPLAAPAPSAELAPSPPPVQRPAAQPPASQPAAPPPAITPPTAPPPAATAPATVAPAPAAPAAPAASEVDEDPFGHWVGQVGRTRFIDGPRVAAANPVPRHGLAWLPAQPQTNADEFEVFVACDADPRAAVRAGVPSPDLFLTGHLDAELLAKRSTAAHLLQVHVAPGGAVDLPASELVSPPASAAVLTFSDSYVLPAGWLGRCEIVASYRVTPDRTLVRQSEFTGGPLLLATTGARHGVPGLPTDVVRWPHARLRSGAVRYVLVAEGEPLGPWQRLYAERPAPSAGSILFSVRLERAQAIDVTATAAKLAGLTAVRSAAPELVAAGVEVLLPAEVYDAVAIRDAWRAEVGAWRKVSTARGRRLGHWAAEREMNSIP